MKKWTVVSVSDDYEPFVDHVEAEDAHEAVQLIPDRNDMEPMACAVFPGHLESQAFDE